MGKLNQQFKAANVVWNKNKKNEKSMKNKFATTYILVSTDGEYCYNEY